MIGIVCCGLSHRTAGVELRERFAFPAGEIVSATRDLVAREGVMEAVILSTCNRVEIYSAVERGAEGEVQAFFGRRADPRGSIEEALYVWGVPQSVEHLFRVASGMDSMVFGETEIFGQVKEAYDRALRGGCTGKWLNRLFQNAMRAAKRVRTQTGITRGAISVASVAVDLAGQIFGDLSRCRVMIVGAGEMGERTARSLLSRGASGVIVSNRSRERAAELAAEFGGRSVDFDGWEAEFADLDIVISSTSAPHFILTREKLVRMMAGRGDRPLFLIDIGVPRDIEPAVNEIEGVYLYDIDSLRVIAERAMADRQRERDLCERIVREHVDEFGRWLRGHAGGAVGIDGDDPLGGAIPGARDIR